ncbi:MAG: CopG family transcriptional regulator [Betaproteobacteria bacterium RIFCSPHIGHO2_12_FULL_69_13]|nr:MAG: CopG family transcriptional regulator [Betaproteobacteria bacterium RIFCSPHIGHO2_12_FULL_69_13]OGA66668.1 MAG: CopG family transcriptional regulator [Betaproteobacteria bacterium RIFCSPLOWO2_12_FULL_68_20]
MLALRLERDLEAKLAALAKVRGRSKSEVVRDAIVRMIEDEEDLELVEKALRTTRMKKTLRQLRKELGLDR